MTIPEKNGLSFFHAILRNKKNDIPHFQPHGFRKNPWNFPTSPVLMAAVLTRWTSAVGPVPPRFERWSHSQVGEKLRAFIQGEGGGNLG